MAELNQCENYHPDNNKNQRVTTERWQTGIAKWMGRLKVVLQMIIGLAILILIAYRLFLLFAPDSYSIPDKCQSGIFCIPVHWKIGKVFLPEASILAIVSNALAYAAAIELAYMLFTPGPDEAVEPLILGLASFVLSVAARADYYIEEETQSLLDASISISISVIAIGVLFYVRERFINKKRIKQTQPDPSKQEPISLQIPEIKVVLQSENRDGCGLFGLFRKGGSGSK